MSVKLQIQIFWKYNTNSFLLELEIRKLSFEQTVSWRFQINSQNSLATGKRMYFLLRQARNQDKVAIAADIMQHNTPFWSTTVSEWNPSPLNRSKKHDSKFPTLSLSLFTGMNLVWPMIYDTKRSSRNFSQCLIVSRASLYGPINFAAYSL